MKLEAVVTAAAVVAIEDERKNGRRKKLYRYNFYKDDKFSWQDFMGNTVPTGFHKLYYSDRISRAMLS